MSQPRTSAFEAHEAPTLGDRWREGRPSLVDPLVLVADDDDEGRGIYCASLQQMGYRTIECDNGDLALKDARARRPDVVLTDIAMPLVDGLELARRIRADEDLRATCIIIMTAFGDSKYAEAVGVGCDAFLCKPFNPSLLEDILSARFGGGAHDVVKRCACGREYTRAQWSALPFCGAMLGIELRTCACGSSIAVEPNPSPAT
ncbi:MAG: response regulator [Polyangiaceae bacterium]